MSSESQDTAQKEKFVITPTGPRPKSSVHAVEPGEVVCFDESGNAQVIPRKQEGGTMNIPEGMVVTPGGLRPKSLVHLIEPDHVLDGTGNHLQKLDPNGLVVADFGPIPSHPGNVPLMPGNVVVLPKEAPALGDGWIASAHWNNDTGTPISFFATTWIVPRTPATQSGQLIYLFNGIQNSTMIYQPVLQWGYNGIFGGNYWGVASWYADGKGGQAHYSQYTQVNTGQILIGVMTLTSQSGNLYNYDCQFQGITNSRLTIQNVQELTYAVETLEAYGVTKASDYPATDGMVFWEINIQTGGVTPTLNWTPVNQVTDTGQHAVVLSNSNPRGEVEIYNRQAGPLSFRRFLLTHGIDPSIGVRKFIQGHYPGISDLRALLEL